MCNISLKHGQTSQNAGARSVCCPTKAVGRLTEVTVQAETAAAELERARRDAERARAPAAGGQLQRRIAELESQLAAADAQIQQLTVHRQIGG